MTVARGDGSPERLGGALRRLHYKATRRAHSAAGARHHTSTPPKVNYLAAVASSPNLNMGYKLSAMLFILSASAMEAFGLKFPPFPPDVDYTPSFSELAASHGYVTETHNVTTDDGYILTLFRIRQGKKCSGPVRTPPVLMVHGFLNSAENYIDGGPDQATGYLVADACYDTWFGNVRGTFNSRAHVTLNPNTDSEYWQYSSDEIGMHDLPAFVDYVLNATGVQKLNYIGFSQGGGTFFIMCSEKPGYCDKINLYIGLAPVTRLLNTKSIPFRIILTIFKVLLELFQKLGLYEILTKGYPIQKILHSLCSTDFLAVAICGSIDSILDSLNPGSVTGSTLKVAFQHTPGGISTKQAAKYGQALTQTGFNKFDYGAVGNLKEYGTITPPEYNLTSVTAPVVVIQGMNDGAVSPKDSRWAADQMPNLIEYHTVENPLWGHLDCVRSQYIPIYTFPVIKRYLDSYSSGGNVTTLVDLI